VHLTAVGAKFISLWVYINPINTRSCRCGMRDAARGTKVTVCVTTFLSNSGVAKVPYDTWRTSSCGKFHRAKWYMCGPVGHIYHLARWNLPRGRYEGYSIYKFMGVFGVVCGAKWQVPSYMCGPVGSIWQLRSAKW
jgi:hypothetical protein